MAAVSFLVERIGQRPNASPSSVTGVSDNPKKPRAPVSAGKRPKVPERSQRGFLHDILRVGFIPRQPARQPIRGVEMGQHHIFEGLSRAGCVR